MRMMTLICAGTSVIPGQFVLFWMLNVVMRVVGSPPVSMVNEGSTGRVGAMTVADATPVARPGVSRKLIIGVVKT